MKVFTIQESIQSGVKRKTRWTRPIQYIVDRFGCHICISHDVDRPYPRFTMNGKTVRLSRYVWEITKGKVPDGVFVCHKCDNPRCINTDHLFLGICGQNNLDMISKKSAWWQNGKYSSVIEKIRNKQSGVPKVGSRGEHNGNSRLTKSNVSYIRKMYPEKSAKTLAQELGVSLRTVFAVIRRETWDHVE